MPALPWLTARPIAHRGLHDAAHGVIENMPGAIEAAIAGDYGIEVDLQLAADGEAMVHHDATLGRLTDGAGRLDTLTAAQLQAVPFKATRERMLRLGDLLDLVAGRTPVVIELKSHPGRGQKLAERAATVLQAYRGPVAAMSFDPAIVVALRQAAPTLTRGIVAERRYDDDEWRGVAGSQKWAMAHLAHFPSTRPDFAAYRVDDLPAPGPWLARNLLGRPLLTWTVRTPAQRARAARHADQIIFEGFRP